MGFATKEQVAAIFKAIKERDEDRQARMPDTIAALDQAATAKDRLRKLGWSEGSYCPKDGTKFALVEWGSTGVHLGHYIGEWPTGHIYCGDFLLRPQSVMFKPLDQLTDDEKAALDISIEDDRQFMERQARMLSDRTTT